MTKREFVQDYAGILNLLKEHAFLQYSPSGAQEYEQKQRSAVGYFVHLLFKQTGFDLPVPDYRLVDIGPNHSPSYAGARIAVKRTISQLKAASADLSRPRREDYASASRAWARALALLEEERAP